MSTSTIGEVECLAAEDAQTVVVATGDDITEVSEQVDTAGRRYAWSEESDETAVAGGYAREPAADGRWFRMARRRVDPRIVPAGLVAVAIAAVSIVGTLALAPRTAHFGIIAAPVEQTPPPPPKAAPPPPKAVAAPPPVQRVVPRTAVPPRPARMPVQSAAPPVQEPLPGANQRFSSSLAHGGMWQNESDDDQQARDLCQDLANGGNTDDYVAGTERKSPQLTPQEATQVVRDAIDAYCPQYDNP